MVMPTYGHSRAGFTGLAGRMRPAGRQLDNAEVDSDSVKVRVTFSRSYTTSVIIWDPIVKDYQLVT